MRQVENGHLVATATQGLETNLQPLIPDYPITTLPRVGLVCHPIPYSKLVNFRPLPYS